MTKYLALAILTLAACAPTPDPDPDGTWQITAVCPATSPLGPTTINATAKVAEISPGTFVGELRNSRGQRGRINAALSGETLEADLNWGSGFSEATLTQQGSPDIFTGTDTYDCEITTRRQI
ncbi:hypothetical protein [Roseobacter sinensis]|uniref:Lipoprotein n=1 Tax=Roseobacter sinensis TaxID=2931391 RepID=A0ABT3BD70_9RHOB|nr:hypothetical protein [Roseobacter sp. WL0113]MCV3271513.1 hypothetical protein [Roseobacter sp. WL0113]